MTDLPTTPVAQLDTPPKSILVVEDEVLLRFVIADYLRDCGYQVIEANDASEAVALLTLEPPDLVFSDVRMPGEMDGLGLARWVRTNRPGLPVILTSGDVQTADLGEELCEIGPVERKPNSTASLVTRMQTILAKAGQA